MRKGLVRSSRSKLELLLFATRRLDVILTAIFAVAGVSGFDGNAAAAESNTAVAYQINVAHNGVQVDSSLSPPFVRRWQVTLPGLVSYPLIAQGLVFVSAGDGTTGVATLYALDQASGHTVWSQRLSPPPPIAPWANAAYDNGRVFAVGTAGQMTAYDAATGALLWATILPSQFLFSSPPTAANGVVYTGGAGSAGTVYSVDQDSGNVLATQSVANGDHSSPALSDSSVFVSYACNQAYGFAQATLGLLWHYSTDCSGGGGKTPVYQGGRVYTRDGFGNLILDAATGSLLGSYSPPSTAPMAAPAVSGNTMWLLRGLFPDATLSAQDISAPSNPVTIWSFTGDHQLVTAPIVVSTPGGDFVIEGSASGMLYVLNAATGDLVWSTNVGASIQRPDEQNISQPLTGLGAGQGLIVVPAGNTVSAFSIDTSAPIIAIPGTITVNATSPQGAVVTYSVSATDPDDAASVPVCTPASGNQFPIGTTQVGCTSTDTHGNTGRAGFIVQVVDATAPILTVPATITANATSPQGAIVSYSVSATDSDDAAGAPVCTPASASLFPIGTTQVSCSSKDTHGNTGRASFSVHINGAAEQLANLLVAVAGVGNGTSLADKVKQIQAYVATSNKSKACAGLKDFLSAVSAQAGKSITTAQAVSFTAQANDIKAALGC